MTNVINIQGYLDRKRMENEDRKLKDLAIEFAQLPLMFDLAELKEAAKRMDQWQPSTI